MIAGCRRDNRARAEAAARRRRMKNAERHGCQRVSPEPRLVRRPVERDESRVDRGLIEWIEAHEGGRDFSADPSQRVLHVEAAEALSAIALVDRLRLAARGAGRRNAPPTAPSLSLISASTVDGRANPRCAARRRDWMTGSVIATLPRPKEPA